MLWKGFKLLDAIADGANNVETTPETDTRDEYGGERVGSNE